MATKTNLISAINTQLTAIITQAKVRLASLQIVNELYPNVINDTQATTNVFTASSAGDRHYNLVIVKQGRCVTIKGILKNDTDEIVSDLDFARITTPEFLPSETTTYYGSGELGQVRFNLNVGGALSVVGAMAGQSEIYINFTYFTLN